MIIITVEREFFSFTPPRWYYRSRSREDTFKNEGDNSRFDIERIKKKEGEMGLFIGGATVYIYLFLKKTKKRKRFTIEELK